MIPGTPGQIPDYPRQEVNDKTKKEIQPRLAGWANELGSTGEGVTYKILIG